MNHVFSCRDCSHQWIGPAPAKDNTREKPHGPITCPRCGSTKLGSKPKDDFTAWVSRPDKRGRRT